MNFNESIWVKSHAALTINWYCLKSDAARPLNPCRLKINWHCHICPEATEHVRHVRVYANASETTMRNIYLAGHWLSIGPQIFFFCKNCPASRYRSCRRCRRKYPRNAWKKSLLFENARFRRNRECSERRAENFDNCEQLLYYPNSRCQ